VDRRAAGLFFALAICVLGGNSCSGADANIVLDDSCDPKAKSADPKRFYDNSLIQVVNRDYASKLFPGEFK
jgi:hypothetical protein